MVFVRSVTPFLLVALQTCSAEGGKGSRVVIMRFVALLLLIAAEMPPLGLVQEARSERNVRLVW